MTFFKKKVDPQRSLDQALFETLLNALESILKANEEIQVVDEKGTRTETDYKLTNSKMKSQARVALDYVKFVRGEKV